MSKEIKGELYQRRWSARKRLQMSKHQLDPAELLELRIAAMSPKQLRQFEGRLQRLARLYDGPGGP